MAAAELLAIGSALAFAVTNILVRNALKAFSSPFTAVVMFFSATVAMWAVVAGFGYELPSSTYAFALFALRGVLDPGIAALLVFVALRTIGVAITVPIIAASSLVSTSMSVILLKESLTAAIISGTLLIIGGVVLLTRKQGKTASGLKYVLLAVLGSVAIGAANVATKLALNSSNTPISGIAVAFTAGLAFQLIVLILLKKWDELPLKLAAAKPFVLAGLLVAGAFTLMFLATGAGNVSVIIPLLSTQSLFTLILSFLLLRQQEKITKSIVLGTLAIVTGAVLLSAA